MTRFLRALVLPSLALVASLATACADGAATRYVGTVMHEAAPDSAGSLALTLFSHTDTGFSGVIELGAPARGTGAAYAWHEGGELHVVTVGAQTADTIHWISPLTDEGLGGRFEVTGGDRAGQTGTWRARLVRGPPATPATLRRPPSIPVPALSALWPLALLLVAGVLLARWVRRAPRPPVMADGTPWRAARGPLVGIRGWLILFIYGQVVGVVIWLVRLGATWEEYTSGVAFGAAMTGAQALTVLGTAVQLLSMPIALGGLVLLFRRSHLAPRYWCAYLAASGVYLLVDALLAPFIQARVVQLVGEAGMEDAFGPGERAQQLRQLLVTFVWALYWMRAERVRRTFGAAALDREFTATVASTGTTTEAAPAQVRRPRSWRRVAAWTAGILLVLFVVPLGFGLWASRVTPYELPEGKDIRAHVTGRWAWDSDSLGCRDAHSIAFAEDGKVMTITSASIRDPEPVTTYDIEVVSRSTIRGAIRGETRMDDDGKPVVWDLVLTGPGEYRWKIAGANEIPWNYSGTIRRCPRAQPVDTKSTRASASGAAPPADTARGR